MAVSHLPDNHAITSIDIDKLAPCQFNDKTDIAVQIANHLRKALEIYGNGHPPSLRLPSVMTLAWFYRQSILEVLDGLFELKCRHYEYVMNGLDADIILHDPLARRKPRNDSKWNVPLGANYPKNGQWATQKPPRKVV